jgi:hypothetical protein
MKKRHEEKAEEIVDTVLGEFERLAGKEKMKSIEKNITSEVKRAAEVLKRLEGEETSREFLVLYALLSITEKRLGKKSSQAFKVACAMYGALRGKLPEDIVDYIM